MKDAKEEALEILKNTFTEYPKEYLEIIDLSSFNYPLIKKVNYVTGAFKDIYLKV